MSSHPYTTDTSPAAEAAQLELVREMAPAMRLEKTLRLSSELLRTAKAAIRRRYPAYTEQDVAIKFIELHYGAELAAGVRSRLESRTS
jgi:hypothetical protein